MRTVSLIVVLSVAAAAVGTTRTATGAPAPIVRCEKIIGAEGAAAARTRQVVLDAVSISAYLPQTVETLDPAWPYWSKTGLVIRGGAPAVSISVPLAWRNRAGITWGNTGVVGALRVASCPRYGSKSWNAYAGGFLLRSRSACVPLVIRVGPRAATARFGVGRRC